MQKTSGAEGDGKYCKKGTLKGIKKMLEKIGCEIYLNEQVILDESTNTVDANTKVASVIHKSIQKQQASVSSTSSASPAGMEYFCLYVVYHNFFFVHFNLPHIIVVCLKLIGQYIMKANVRRL